MISMTIGILKQRKLKERCYRYKIKASILKSILERKKLRKRIDSQDSIRNSKNDKIE
jgi:hypothetical protein